MYALIKLQDGTYINRDHVAALYTSKRVDRTTRTVIQMVKSGDDGLTPDFGTDEPIDSLAQRLATGTMEPPKEGN